MKKKTIVIAGLSVLVVLLIAYIGGGMYYSSRFLPNTTIGTTKIAGDTPAEANRKVVKELHAKQIDITENNEILATFTPSDLEANVQGEAFLTQVKEEQGAWSWPIAFFQEDMIVMTDEAVSYNDEAVQALITSFTLDETERVAPKNAWLKNEGDSFTIQAEVKGTQVDRALLEETITAALTNDQAEVRLEDTYLQPTLTSESPELKAAVDKLTNLADTVITYTLAGEEIVVPREKIVSWLGVDGQGNPTVDQAGTKAFVDELHEKYSTYEKTRKFKSTNRGTVEVPAGEYGWSIATQAEAENLASYILLGEDMTVTPEILGSGYHEDGTDIGGSYVEVDLVGQIMYMYKDGKKVFESPIVAGHPETPTPVGVFYAWDKVEDTELVGYNPRRDADYATPVNYWVPVDWEGIGIHDASWQGSFATNEWQTNGSNGCINTPPGAMAKFFPLLEIGMPVVMF